MKQSFIFCFAVFMIQCEQPTTKTDASTKRIENRKKATEKLIEDSSNTNCSELLLQLIKSSSLDKGTKKLQFELRLAKLKGWTEIFELTYRNEERNENVSLGWIEIDFKKNELRDITIDPENPIKLKYDTLLFKKMTLSCKPKFYEKMN